MARRSVRGGRRVPSRARRARISSPRVRWRRRRDRARRRELLRARCGRRRCPQALLRIFLQAALQENANADGRGRRELRPIGLFFDYGGERVGDSFAAKSHLAAEHFVKDAAEGPDVRAAVDGLGFGLFRRHVRGGAEQNSRQRGHAAHGRRSGDVHRCGIAFEGFGEAEVENFHGVVGGEFDVGGFEIAMDDAVLVRVFERLANLAGDRQGFSRSELVPGGGDRREWGLRRAPSRARAWSRNLPRRK